MAVITAIYILLSYRYWRVHTQRFDSGRQPVHLYCMILCLTTILQAGVSLIYVSVSHKDCYWHVYVSQCWRSGIRLGSLPRIGRDSTYDRFLRRSSTDRFVLEIRINFN